ncbi:MAG: DUF4830 domain-containing protein [Clostridia bacterium]|nr:DUF4830 domain-containing protein [Clostridia bacterium]
MFILSFKATKKRAVLFFAAACAIAAVFMLILSHQGCESAPAADARAEFDGASNNDGRVFYLESLGLTVTPDPVETSEVEIPDEFGDVYARYNEIQKTAGFDLEQYRGESCMRYTYHVHNFDEADSEVYANLLVFEGRVIGGDICVRDLDGFMLPLNAAENVGAGKR